MAWAATLPLDTSKIRLSANFIRQNNSAVQSVVSQPNLDNATPYIPSTHPVYFYSNTAPTGWTLVGAVTDALLAIKGGSSVYNVPGGTIAGTWNGPAYALLNTQIPNLSTSFTVFGGNSGTSDVAGSDGTGPSGNVIFTVNSGGGGTHQHDWDNTIRPFAAVGILAIKDV